MAGLVPFNWRHNGLQRKNNGFPDFERMFENFFSDSFLPAGFGELGQMRVDIKETEKEYTLEAEMPGVKKESINIEVRDNMLTISANNDEQIEEEKENYIRRERRSSSMSRSFSLENVQHDKITARHDNGILTLTLPKKEVSKPSTRKIDIN